MNVKRKCRICQTTNPDDFRGSKMKTLCNLHRNTGNLSLDHIEAISNQQTVRKLWLVKPRRNAYPSGYAQVFQRHALESQDMSITP